MKLRTNYDEMTNVELLEELQHRNETYAETLGGYESGGVSVGYQHKAYWLNSIEENHFTLSKLFDNQSDDVVVKLDDPEFRVCLLSMLKGEFTTFNNHESENEDQNVRLEDIACAVCSEHIENGSGNFFIEHIEIENDDRDVEEWADDILSRVSYFSDTRMHVNVEKAKMYVDVARTFAKEYKLEIWNERADALENKANKL